MTAVLERVEPREAVCGCGARVLHTEAGLLDWREVYPLAECGACRGKGHRGVRVASGGYGPWLGRVASTMGDRCDSTTLAHTSCPDCFGTGVQGEPLTSDMVLMDAYGRVRDYDGERHPGEAAYRRHAC